MVCEISPQFLKDITMLSIYLMKTLSKSPLATLQKCKVYLKFTCKIKRPKMAQIVLKETTKLENSQYWI
jgi:hypothetical protein